MVTNKMSARLQSALRYESLMTESHKAVFIDDIPNQIWILIVEYTGSFTPIKEALNLEILYLGPGFVQVFIRKDDIAKLSDYFNVRYMSLPKRMKYIDIGLTQVCAGNLQPPRSTYDLTGEGVLLAVIDTGINYAHPDFRNDDNSTRIEYIWDQNIEGNPPVGFIQGSEYTREQIDEALQAETVEGQRAIVPSEDIVGHGTAITGVAGGNGRGSAGQRNKGMAPGCQFIIVKLLMQGSPGNARDNDVMQGIRYALEKAEALNKPVSILLGCGYNVGSHRGDEPLASYIRSIYNIWPCNITVGTGNEGNKGSHVTGILLEREWKDIQFIIGKGLKYFSLGIWASVTEEFEIVLQSPSGETTEALNQYTPNRAFLFKDTVVIVNFSMPIINVTEQQILITLETSDEIEDISDGIWSLYIYGKNIDRGVYSIWSSIQNQDDNNTRFLVPSLECTLTSPSDAIGLTAVASYNTQSLQLAAFSGRGFTADLRVSPLLTAPATNIQTPSIDLSELYVVRSGSSLAGAFVAGAYVLMMQYGIVQRKNINMFGKTLQSYLMRTAQEMTSSLLYPNIRWGYGLLCVEAALNLMRDDLNVQS